MLRLIVNDDGEGQDRSSRRTASRSADRVSSPCEVPDRPGGLHSILERCRKEKINVEYMYAFVERSGENAVIIFRFDATDRAIDVLTKSGFTVLPGDKVYSL